MTNKIYRYQILALFVFALINIYYLFFKEALPDNALLITNSSESIFTLSYIFSSFVAYASYYIGPWIIAPFVVCSLVYTFVISKRDDVKDYFIPFLVLLSSFLFALLIWPSSLGNGLLQISNTLVSSYTAFFLFVLFSFVTLYILTGGNIVVGLKTIQLKLERIGFRLIAVMVRAFKRVKESKSKIKSLPVASKASSFLRKEKKLDLSEARLPNETVNKPNPKIENVQAVKVTEPEPVKTSDNIDRKEKNSQLDESQFFNSSDLIDCISSSTNDASLNPSDEYFKTITQAIEEKLAEFKIQATIINVLKGPVVDTFELDLGEGVKLSKVLGVSDDIGLALNGVPIRIVYPLRGRSTIGIEVPRNPREFIYLDEVLRSEAFNDSQYRLPVAMGKDAFGAVKVVDLAGMPHMLVAGATGAGKSVFINALLTSLIIKKSPKELKLILIDPKQLELATFQELPHLMLPVLTDPKSSSIALLWLVQEMDRRYTVLKDMGVKNIEGFNKKLQSASPAQRSKIAMHYDGATDEYELPYIVCVIDEFADLILTKTGKEIEINVNRLAAKARAAGIHMVVATQRPSTDVVTGVIKANFPTRVAFRVTTGHDSKTILDQYGAEKLLGRGDMLYKHGVELLRLHSSFVDEDEIEGLVAKLAEIPSDYDDQAVNFLDNGGDELDSEQNGEVKTFVSGTTDDPVYDEAVQIVMQKGSASASMLQRSLRVGYNRAANIIDELERNGIVGPAQGSKPRKVLSRGE